MNHVLIVDDEAEIRASLEEILREEGYGVATAGTAGEAITLLQDAPYDVVLLTNFLHHFDRPTCVGLLEKIHAALRPGGWVATLDFVPDEGKVSPPPSAGFAMTMLTTTAAGDVYTLAELTSMYEEAGFGGVEGRPIPMSPETVVMGRA